jgi:hypothetical protein
MEDKMTAQKYPIRAFYSFHQLGDFLTALQNSPTGERLKQFGGLSAERATHDGQALWTLYFVAKYWPQKVLRSLDEFAHTWTKEAAK